MAEDDNGSIPIGSQVILELLDYIEVLQKNYDNMDKQWQREARAAMREKRYRENGY